MDWQAPGKHAIRALSETEMAKARIHDGDHLLVFVVVIVYRLLI